MLSALFLSLSAPSLAPCRGSSRLPTHAPPSPRRCPGRGLVGGRGAPCKPDSADSRGDAGAPWQQHSPWRGQPVGSAGRAQPPGLSCLPLSAGGRDPGGCGGGVCVCVQPGPARPPTPRGATATASLPRGAAPSERSAFKCPRRGAVSATGAGEAPRAPQPLAAAPHVPARCRRLRVIFLPAPWRKWESWRGPAGR